MILRMRWALLPVLIVLVALSGCRPKVPLGGDFDPPDRRLRVPELDLKQEPTLRILLIQSVNGVELSSNQGLKILNARGRQLARYGRGKNIRLFQRTASPDRLGVFTEFNRRGRKMRAQRKSLAFKDAVIIQAERNGIIRLNGHSYRGRMLLLRKGKHFHCINLVALEQYLRGVVPHEIGNLGRKGFEAMKAQAVISRNYAVQRMQDGRNADWDMVDTVFDQVYRGARGEHDLASRAVEATRGQILWTGKSTAEVYYSSTCGGSTTAIEKVWNHAGTQHLVSIRDADDQGRSWCRGSKYFRWKHSWSARELGRILRSYLPQAAGLDENAPIGHLIDLEIRSFTPEGRVKELDVLTTLGTFRVRGDRVRTALKRDIEGNALRSIMFRLGKQYDERKRLTRVTAYGAGWGHGIGLCQVGAIARAKAGQRYSTILTAYYPRTSLRQLWR
jgi:stage II sporulation protein D